LNDYLQDTYNIPAFQHRILQRLSVFSFKMLNFIIAPKILKETTDTKIKYFYLVKDKNLQLL
jgi:hypothetical protein